MVPGIQSLSSACEGRRPLDRAAAIVMARRILDIHALAATNYVGAAAIVKLQDDVITPALVHPIRPILLT